MRKLVLFLSIILLISSVAIAEVDFTTMSPQELVDIISKAGSALEMFNPVEDENVLYDKDGLVITIGSIDYMPNYDEIQLNLVVINDTNDEALIYFPDVLVNGWAVDHHYHNSVRAHSKSRDVTLSIEDICRLADLETFDEIESIEAFGLVQINGKYKEMHYIMTYTSEEGLKIISREYID